MPDVEVVEEKCMNSEKSFRGHTDLNHGPIGLQPIALPLSYIPYSSGPDSLWILLWRSNYQKSLTVVYVHKICSQK